MTLSKDARIVIIGAGAAGLSSAIALKKRGYHDITILEKETEIGGKCSSFNYQEQVFDFGANLTTPRYQQIRDLAIEVGMTFRTPPTRRIVSVDTEPYVSPADSDFFTKLLIRAGALVYTAIR